MAAGPGPVDDGCRPKAGRSLSVAASPRRRAGATHGGARPPAIDGSSAHYVPAARGGPEEPAGAEWRELRRVQGQSVSQLAGPVGAAKRQEGQDGQDVVARAPSRNRRVVRPRDLWTGSQSPA